MRGSTALSVSLQRKPTDQQDQRPWAGLQARILYTQGQWLEHDLDSKGPEAGSDTFAGAPHPTPIGLLYTVLT
jgi:hypothetical protein